MPHYIQEMANELAHLPISNPHRIFTLLRTLGCEIVRLSPSEFEPHDQARFAEVSRRVRNWGNETMLTADNYPRVIRMAQELSQVMNSYRCPQEPTPDPSNTVIHNFTGVFGNVSNSSVQIHDFSSIHQLVKSHGVPQAERNDLENIVDDLKEAGPEREKGVLERAKSWITRNERLLGASTTILRKALRIE